MADNDDNDDDGSNTMLVLLTYRGGQEESLIQLCGFSKTAFDALLQKFLPVFNAYTPHSKDSHIRCLSRQPCHSRLLNATSCLGLVLTWLHSHGSALALCFLYGIVPASCRVWLRFGKRVLLKVLMHVDEARVVMPTPHQAAKYVAIINEIGLSTSFPPPNTCSLVITSFTTFAVCDCRIVWIHELTSVPDPFHLWSTTMTDHIDDYREDVVLVHFFHGLELIHDADVILQHCVETLLFPVLIESYCVNAGILEILPSPTRTFGCCWRYHIMQQHHWEHWGRCRFINFVLSISLRQLLHVHGYAGIPLLP